MSLRIGLIGVGPWGAHILRDLRALGAETACVARSAESKARAAIGGAGAAYDAIEQLPDCDGYVIATRASSHLDAVEALLPRARPIFCEKPLALDVARAKRLPDAAHRLLFIMHKWRYHPGVVELARIAEEGDYGPAEGLRSYRLGWGNAHVDASSLWVLAPHDLSIALAILGETPQLIAAAPDAIDPDGGAVAHLRTTAGAPVTIEVSSAHQKPLRRIVLRCRDASCQLDSEDYAAISVRRHHRAEVETIRVSDELPLLRELRAFLAHLNGGPAPATSLAEEIPIIETIAAIERAIAPP